MTRFEYAGGKRAHITPDGEKIIVMRSLEYPRLDRPVLAEKLQTELGSHGWDKPQIEVLEKKISKYRKLSTDSPEEMSWSTARAFSSSDKSPLQPEALAAVLKAWKYKVEHSSGLTMREAKWAARLSAVKHDTEDLLKSVSDYAGLEIICELTKRPFNSTLADKRLMQVEINREDVKSLFSEELLNQMRDKTLPLLPEDQRAGFTEELRKGTEKILEKFPKKKGGTK